MIHSMPTHTTQELTSPSELCVSHMSKFRIISCGMRSRVCVARPCILSARHTPPSCEAFPTFLIYLKHFVIEPAFFSHPEPGEVSYVHRSALATSDPSGPLRLFLLGRSAQVKSRLGVGDFCAFVVLTTGVRPGPSQSSQWLVIGSGTTQIPVSYTHLTLPTILLV